MPDASRSNALSGATRTLDDRYALRGAIGHGASATVFLADDRRLARRVAVKMALPSLAHDPRFRRRFQAEARSAAQLSHPHLLAVFDWSNDPGDAYLVTEFLAGGSLRSMLEAGHRLSLSQALMAGLHAAEGLAHAHGHGFVHRDIKPANILFGSDGRLRIADFGIARAVAEATWTEPEGSLIGTARYAAPEQAKGDAVDGRSDVYSLALTLIEAVTGTVPLVGSTPLATMVQRQDSDVPELEAMGALGPIVARAGSADPANRPTAEEFAQQLLAAAPEFSRPAPLPLVLIDEEAVGRAGDASLVSESSDSSSLDHGDPADLDDSVLAGDSARLDLTSDPVIDLATNRLDRTAEMPEPELSTDDARLADAESTFFDADLDPDLAPEPVGGRGVLFVAVGLVALIGLVIAAISLVPRSAVVPTPTIPEVVTVAVDDFIGSPVEDVRSAAQANGWTLNETTRREDGSGPGEVLEQTPPGGTELAEGATLNVVVSEGAELRIVPDVVGVERALAITAITDAGLVVGTINSEVFDEEVPAGSVVSSSLTALDEVESGTSVDLEVSAGPEPRIVPTLAGLTVAEAEPLLIEQSLVIAVTEEHSTSTAEGLIISSVPAVGESVARDGTVTVVVSLGLPFITVPDVTGMSAVDAERTLIEAGFVVTGTQGSPSGEVLVTNPPAGETYRLGHEILIVTR